MDIVLYFGPVADCNPLLGFLMYSGLQSRYSVLPTRLGPLDEAGCLHFSLLKQDTCIRYSALVFPVARADCGRSRRRPLRFLERHDAKLSPCVILPPLFGKDKVNGGTKPSGTLSTSFESPALLPACLSAWPAVGRNRRWTCSFCTATLTLVTWI